MLSALSAYGRFRRRVGAARSVSFTSDLVAPFALRQTTFFSLPCLGTYLWLRAKLLIRRRVLRIPHSRHPSAPANFHASPLKGVASRGARRRRTRGRLGDVMSDLSAACTVARLGQCRESRASKAQRAESTRSTRRAYRPEQPRRDGANRVGRSEPTEGAPMRGSGCGWCA